MSRFPKIVGLCIYFFVLLTSFYHVFKFYEIFERPNESFVAFFVSIGFELALMFFAYAHTKYALKSATYPLVFSLFIVWFGNMFIMYDNILDKNMKLAFMNIPVVKFALTSVASMFLPLCSFYMGKVLASLDTIREDNKSRKTDTPIPAPTEALTKINVIHVESIAQKSESVDSHIEAAKQDTETLGANVAVVAQDIEALQSNISTAETYVGHVSDPTQTPVHQLDLSFIDKHIDAVNGITTTPDPVIPRVSNIKNRIRHLLQTKR